jgi:hypothetical protein
MINVPAQPWRIAVIRMRAALLAGPISYWKALFFCYRLRTGDPMNSCNFSTRFAVDRFSGSVGWMVALAIAVIAHGAIGWEDAAYGASAGRTPNVVFILADDLRPDGLHALGNPVVKTPSLDRLVEQGFVFRSAYTQGSSVPAVCLPSRTMIQTGQSYLHVRRDAPTLAQTVRHAGFASIRSGKFGNNPNRLDADFDQHLDGINAQGNADNVIRFIRAQAGKKP